MSTLSEPEPTPTPGIVCLHDRERISSALGRQPLVNLYHIGDLDDFHWPHATWYGLERQGELEAVALVYSGSELPVLLALAGPDDRPAMERLVSGILRLLPVRFYAHLTPGLSAVLARGRTMVQHGLHMRMALAGRGPIGAVAVDGVEWLGEEHLAELERFYAHAYPDNWFEPRMLVPGACSAVREGGELVAVAGVHVVSDSRRVAALGNIATAPEHRGRGLARRVTAALCRRLLERVDHVGLNVAADNAPAIACYRSLGFVPVIDYEEWEIGRP